MIDAETVKGILRAFRGEIKEEDNGNFILTYNNQSYIVGCDDILSYLQRKTSIKKSTETQIWMPGYYEHVVRFEGAGSRRFGRPNEDTLCIEASDRQTKIEVGRPSAMFCLSLGDAEKIDSALRRFTPPGLGLLRSTRNDLTISEIFRFYTIKVSSSSDNRLGRSSDRMHELAEAAIFHFAYGYGTSISFTKSWDRTYYWLGRKQSESVQFPLRIYKSELVSYYNLALGTDSLVLGYIALYKIIEYFYTSVSETVLHQKIRDQLASPDFSYTKTKKLRDLVKTVVQFENKLDELSAIKLVLGTYFEKSQLRHWIVEYERENGLYFTEEQEIFSSKVRIDISDNAIIGTISARIYAIRNVLVHNKEGEIARFIPYSGQEEIINKEIKILQYIAEQIIIKSGRDIT